jgi:hypothetical protein
MSITRRNFLGNLAAIVAAGSLIGCGSETEGGSSPGKPKPPKPVVDIIKNKNMHEGIQLTSWYQGDYSSPSLDVTLDRLQNLGVESISVLATWYQDTINSTSIYAKSPKTPLDSDVMTALGKIKSRGMRAVLKPHVDPNTGWRGDINFSSDADWAKWFGDYNTFITHYADIADKKGADLFVIGTELCKTVNRPEWQAVIENVRQIYGKEVVYASNWDSYFNVPFWNRLDFIGVDGYFPLTAKYDPSQDELNNAWLAHAQTLKNFSEANGKKIILTELGYQNRNGANISPWWAPTSSKDDQEQAMCYEAAFNALFNKEFIAGIYFWDTHWNTADYDGFAFLGKQAETVVNDWYHREG